MRTISRRIGWGAVVLALGLLGVVAPARADLSLGFSSGLSGWTVDPSGYVSLSGVQATLHENDQGQETDLYLNFTIPTDALSLSFTLVGWKGEDPSGFLPDSFGASLLNSTGSFSLVNTVPSSTDSFYIRDLDPNVSQGEAAMGVSVSPSPGSLPLLVTIDDISSLSGQDARILFRLIGGGPTLDEASVTISDVIVSTSTGPNPVPEPSTMIIVALSAPVLFAYLRRRRERAA